MTVTFFIATSLYLFFLAMEGQNKRLYLVSCALMALAVLTKGPIGIAIPAMTIIPYLILTKRFKETLKEARLFSGAIIFLAIILPWYILEIRANGWEYINAFFLKHNIQRFTSVNSGHSGPIFYYIPVILIGFFPWSAFFFFFIYKLTPRSLKDLNLNERLMLFSVIWFLAVFIFFIKDKAAKLHSIPVSANGADYCNAVKGILNPSMSPLTKGGKIFCCLLLNHLHNPCCWPYPYASNIKQGAPRPSRRLCRYTY
ncbi:MAG: glycosyltransferase family 39 protein, partial [Nitrospirae bacterium]|nr:glycosyltransferase family 39 protein [Nitrospirota bacterium]